VAPAVGFEPTTNRLTADGLEGILFVAFVFFDDPPSNRSGSQRLGADRLLARHVDAVAVLGRHIVVGVFGGSVDVKLDPADATTKP
jgi:hypothetical protein